MTTETTTFPGVQENAHADSGDTTAPSDENRFHKNDFDGIGEDFIKKCYADGDERLIHFFDGHLHCYNGTFYEKQCRGNRQLLDRTIREYVQTLKLANDRKEAVPTPKTTYFYRQIEAALFRTCEITGEEAEKFKTQPPHLVFGKTKIWDMERDAFLPYSPKVCCNYTLQFDVAKADEEPEVWREFFESASMDVRQQRAWWFMLSAILMRDQKHNRLFYLFGNPRSGKGMTSTICTAMFGRDRTAAIPGNMSNTHASSVIVGKLLLTVNDMKFDKRTNHSFVQFLLNVVGDDPLTINPKYEALYDYQPESNVVITSNEVPDFKGNLSGLENKFAFFVFHRTGEIDLTLKSRMLETLPQIIRKAAKIYKEAVASGYAFDTEQGRAIAEQFLEGSSVVREFVEERCVFGAECRVSTVEMFDEFVMYARQRRESIPSISQFVQDITTLYLGQITKSRITVKGKKITAFKGMRLVSPSEQHPTLGSRTIMDNVYHRISSDCHVGGNS